LGVYGPRALRLAVRVADGCVPSIRGVFAPILKIAAPLDDSAADAGRDPGQIRRLLNVGGAITDRASDGMFHGPVPQWADELAQLVKHGFDTFVFGGEPAQLARFAEEVVPATRELVAAERNR
jgi:hypothetical protein